MKQYRHLFITTFCLVLACSSAAASTLSQVTTIAVTLSSLMLGNQGAAFDSFRKTFGGANIEEGYGIFPVSGNRVVVTGFTETDGAGGKDLLFNLYDTISGDLILSKAVGGTGNEIGYSVVDSHDGGFVFVGEIDTAGAGGTDMLVIKINAAADTIDWAYAFGDTGDETARSVKRVPSDDGFIIAGFGDSYGTYDDGMLLKIDSAGGFSWCTALTGQYEDRFYDVEIDSNGNFRVVGATQTYSIENNDVLVAQVSATGNLDWAQGVFVFDESAHGIAMAGDDSFAVVGCIFDLDIGHVEFFMKFDPSATLTHAKAYGLGNIDCSTSVVKTITGYGVTGVTHRTGGQNGQQSLTEFDDINADIEWSKIIGDNDDEDSGNALTIDGDGSFLVTGSIAENNGAGDYNLFFGKYKGDGGADCGPASSPPMAILDVFFDSLQHAVTPTTSSPTLTRTDVKDQLPLTDIGSPVETLICST